MIYFILIGLLVACLAVASRGFRSERLERATIGLVAAVAVVVLSYGLAVMIEQDRRTSDAVINCLNKTVEKDLISVGCLPPR